jgi:beta-glucosidase
MVPNDWKTFLGYLRAAVQSGQIPMSRIDDANRRILTQKFTSGLFEHPYADRSYASTIGSAAHRNLARQAVRESQVLLRNENDVLPLPKSGGRIFVAGKSADDIGNQTGGWTLSWQGASGDTVPGTTILQGIKDAVGSDATVTYARDGAGIDRTYRAAIAVVGETPYAEYEGDRTDGLTLDAEDRTLLRRLKAAGVPVIVVLVSGRPLDISRQVDGWDALVAAWLPGSEGEGVSDVLFGDYAPTGRLPVTWPRSASQEPINDGDGKTGLYAYGYGLTYADRPADTAAPSTPGTPTAPSVTPTALRLRWMAATDAGGSGIDGYDIYRDGILIGATSTLSYAVRGLTAEYRHEFTIVARDKAGNRSAPSSPLVVISPATGGCNARNGACVVT